MLYISLCPSKSIYIATLFFHLVIFIKYIHRKWHVSLDVFYRKYAFSINLIIFTMYYK